MVFLGGLVGFFSFFSLFFFEQVSRTALIQDTDVTYYSKSLGKNQNVSHFIFSELLPLDSAVSQHSSTKAISIKRRNWWHSQVYPWYKIVSLHTTGRFSCNKLRRNNENFLFLDAPHLNSASTVFNPSTSFLFIFCPLQKHIPTTSSAYFIQTSFIYCGLFSGFLRRIQIAPLLSQQFVFTSYFLRENPFGYTFKIWK